MTDAELEEAIYYAMLSIGWLFPTTPEEVAIAEAVLGLEETIELPEALREPPWEKAGLVG